MYLIGAELTGKTGFASMVLVQRVRKELRKYYHVLDIKRSPFNSDVNDMLVEISQIYNDAKYTIRKPRFSQNGRPKKIVNERPLIFVGYNNASLEYIQYLKQKKIPSTCIFVNDEKSWRMETGGKCLKNDFFIPKNNLIQNILDVIGQDRLIVKKDDIGLLEAFNTYSEIRSLTFKTHDVKQLDDLILALAMPVWYYENLLSIRPRTP